MAEKKELSKDDKIKKEMLKLKRIFKDISKDRKSLYENRMFTCVYNILLLAAHFYVCGNNENV